MVFFTPTLESKFDIALLDKSCHMVKGAPQKKENEYNNDFGKRPKEETKRTFRDNMGWAFSQKSSHFQKIRPEFITIQNRLNSSKIPHNTSWAWKPQIHHEKRWLKSTKIYCFTDWAKKTMLLHHKDQAKKSTTFFIKAQDPLSIEAILHSKGELGHWVTRPTFQPLT